MFKKLTLACFGVLFSLLSYATPVLNIVLTSSNSTFPSEIGRLDAPEEFIFTVSNPSGVNLSGIIIIPPQGFTKSTANTTCADTLNAGSSCQLSILFRPITAGNHQGELKICAGNGTLCSVYPTIMNVTVKHNTIVSTNCNDIVSRPFAELTCNGSKQFSDNFETFLTQVLQVSPVRSEFFYYQHMPSTTETTTACLEARQENVGLNSNILGGGIPLCKLMGYAMSNARPDTSPASEQLSKQFPPYLTKLIGTSYPITSSTTPLDELAQLLAEFDTSTMDALVQNTGYNGYVNFLTDYFLQQVSKVYANCGSSEVCSSIFYLPYVLSAAKTLLESWPSLISGYWGMSGGGGGGAGYQIQAFLPGSTTHYILFSGGGGGGAGNTTPENTGTGETPTLINTGSGGGGGSQFEACYIRAGDNLSGLGLGAGTGSGLSTPESTNVTFQTAPAVDYSYIAPASHPTWDDATILANYGDNLTYLFETLLPMLYNQGYTITITGGGGGGSGLEFLNAAGAEFTPHPVSIGYGFNFCYAFNKNGIYKTTDCNPSPDATQPEAKVNPIVYQNVGPLYNQCILEGIKPENCDGYDNFTCLCEYQHGCVIDNMTTILEQYGLTVADLPIWVAQAHCGQSGTVIAKATTCSPPWL